jgi:hypothetical protein
VDDIRLPKEALPALTEMKTSPLSSLYEKAILCSDNANRDVTELGINDLLRKCVHTAVVMVSDTVTSTQRKVTRMQLMLKHTAPEQIQSSPGMFIL